MVQRKKSFPRLTFGQNLDASFELGPILDGDEGGGQVPPHTACSLDDDFSRSDDVSHEIAFYADIPGPDLCLDAAAFVDQNVIVGKRDFPLDLASDDEVFSAADFSLNHARGAEMGYSL